MAVHIVWNKAETQKDMVQWISPHCMLMFVQLMWLPENQDYFTDKWFCLYYVDRKCVGVYISPPQHILYILYVVTKRTDDDQVFPR